MLLASADFARAYTHRRPGRGLRRRTRSSASPAASRTPRSSSSLCVIGVGDPDRPPPRDLARAAACRPPCSLFLGWALASVFWSFDTARLVLELGLDGCARLPRRRHRSRARHPADRAGARRRAAGAAGRLARPSRCSRASSWTCRSRSSASRATSPSWDRSRASSAPATCSGSSPILALITFLIEYRTQSVRPGLSLALGRARRRRWPRSATPRPSLVLAGRRRRRGRRAWRSCDTPAPSAGRALQWALGALVVIGLGVAGYARRHPIIARLGAGTDFSMRVKLWNDDRSTYRARATRSRAGAGSGRGRRASSPSTRINFQLQANHATALNAYFDVLLQLGWLGLILFLAFAGVALVRSWLDRLASAARSSTPGRRSCSSRCWSTRCSRASRSPGSAGSCSCCCAVRAGQSRSWRERMGAPSRADLPHVPERCAEGASASSLLADLDAPYGRLRSVRTEVSTPSSRMRVNIA